MPKIFAKLFRAAATLGVVALTCFIPTPVSAIQPTITRYEYATAASGSFDVHGDTMLGQQFTVGAIPHSTINLKLAMARVGSSPGTVIAEFKALDGGGNPTGIALSSGILNGDLFSLANVVYTFSLDAAMLNAGTQYAWFVSAPAGDGSNYVKVTVKYSSGGYAGGDLIYTSDGGASWTLDNADTCYFEIWGIPAISVLSAIAVQGYIQTGDILFAIEYLNTYPPYYNVTDPKQYFTIRLYDTDNTTLLASTPMLAWGDMPGAIYLNANQAAAIAPGGAYYLKLYGTFGGNPTAVYQLAGADWNGGLTGWIIATARSMESYYSVLTPPDYFVTTLAVYGTVLSGNTNADGSNGGAIFAYNIPSLMSVHPEIFASIVKQPNFKPPPTQTPAPGVQTWQQIVGVNIAGIFNDAGAMLGLDGRWIGTIIILACYVGLALSVTSKGGTPVIALSLGFPVVAFGVWAAFIGYSVIMAAVAVLWLIVLIGYWVTRT